jgi:hypothetical protein
MRRFPELAAVAGGCVLGRRLDSLGLAVAASARA